MFWFSINFKYLDQFKNGFFLIQKLFLKRNINIEMLMLKSIFCSFYLFYKPQWFFLLFRTNNILYDKKLTTRLKFSLKVFLKTPKKFYHLFFLVFQVFQLHINWKRLEFSFRFRNFLNLLNDKVSLLKSF